MKALSFALLLFAVGILTQCDNGTPTPTMPPTEAYPRLAAQETWLARLEYTVGELLIILKEFEGVK